MRWKQIYLARLKREFEDRPFAVDDARALGKKYSPNVVNKLLSEFVREGKIWRTGRGIYSAVPNPGRGGSQSGYIDSQTANKASKVLAEAGVDYMVTGLTVLGGYIDMLPFRTAHLIYVRSGEGESARAALESAGIKYLVNPKNAEEVKKAMSLVDGEAVVIRERKELMGRVGSLASTERALVDLYFESTRDKIPVPLTEVGRIMKEALLGGSVNFTRMTKIASRRGIDEEIRGILVGLGVVPPGKKQVMTRDVRTILKVA
jgi:hypothetical protein